MSKVLSTLDYWEEFSKKYPDKKPFIDFVSQDESLLKIFNFTSDPDINLIKQYPFEDKITEAQSISPEDIERLDDLYIKTGEDPEKEKEAHWLEYLVNLYELVGTTLRLYSMLKGDATLSQNEIIDFINIRFRRHLVIDKTFIIEENDGVQNVKRAIGRRDPFYKLIFTNNNMLLVQFDLDEPTKKEIEKIKNDLDIKSVINFQRYRIIGPAFDRICFGGDYRSNRYQVEFYFRDKILDKFSYPIRKRYEKLIRKTLKPILKEDNGGDIGIDQESLAEEKLSEKALRFDPSTGVRPAGYFKAYFKYYFKNEYYEKVGTTNIPGDSRPMEGAYPYCDEYCKTQKKYENQLPCEYETVEGYCKDLDKKKPRFIWDIEHSGPGLDEVVKDEKGSEFSRQEQFAKSITAIDSEKEKILEEAGLEKEELDLFHLYFEDELTQEDIAKKLKISQSVVSERINLLEKKIKETIENKIII
jgi:predicted DNA-binding protein (UPF0251 family)